MFRAPASLALPVSPPLPDVEIDDLLHRLDSNATTNNNNNNITEPSNAGRFKLVPRIDAKTTSTADLIVAVEDSMRKGIPIVIENCLEAWFTPATTAASTAGTTATAAAVKATATGTASTPDDALFSVAWLLKNAKDMPVQLRNVLNGEDIDGTVESFVSYLEEKKTPSERREEGRVLYGKDITCPPAWAERTMDRVPEFFKYKGQNDLIPLLPPQLQPENLMAYIGDEGTLTPGHTDLCGSVGQNIMVHADEGARAIWFLAESGALSTVSKFWQAQGQSIYRDNFFASVELLATAPFDVYVIEQKQGDFVIVPPETAHQVYNKGGVNIKVSWNRVTVDSLSRCVERVLSEYRVHMRPEIYRIKTLVHYTLQNMTEKAALLATPSTPEKTRKTFAKDFRSVIECFATILKDEWVEGDPKHLPTLWDDVDHPHTRRCDFCLADIWNRGFSCKKCADDHKKNGHGHQRKIIETPKTSAISARRASPMDITGSQMPIANGHTYGHSVTPATESIPTNVPGSSEIALDTISEQSRPFPSPNEPTIGPTRSQHTPAAPDAPAITNGNAQHETAKMEGDDGEDEFDICLDCYAQGRSCPHEKSMTFHEYIPMSVLSVLLTKAVRVYNTIAGSTAPDSLITQAWIDSFYNGSSPIVPTATVAHEIYLLRIDNHRVKPRCCHGCRSSGQPVWTLVADEVCHTVYCARCLWSRFGERLFDIKKDRNWTCPRCRGTCNCLNCIKRWDTSKPIPFPKVKGDVLFLCEQPHFLPHRHHNTLMSDKQYPLGPVYKDGRYKVEEPPLEYRREVVGKPPRISATPKRPLESDDENGPDAHHYNHYLPHLGEPTPKKPRTPARSTATPAIPGLPLATPTQLPLFEQSPIIETTASGRPSRRKSLKTEMYTPAAPAGLSSSSSTRHATTTTPQTSRPSPQLSSITTKSHNRRISLNVKNQSTPTPPSSSLSSENTHPRSAPLSTNHSINTRAKTTPIHTNNALAISSLLTSSSATTTTSRKVPRLKLQTEEGPDRSAREVLAKMDLDTAFCKEFFVECMGLCQERGGGLWAGVHAENVYEKMLGVYKP
ncbi:hypothetical protein PhCBS80983_g03426 [Powellomyces hirtus]|uniref:JmjC domain-containing protein n=1 Tax=Powellomyces hirtus TaxID=109895 RepID=A0A507E4H9_9FUNG|nr:hypothetical protein PhCBS80983_g03426 [Powellomyces hirtus]